MTIRFISKHRALLIVISIYINILLTGCLSGGQVDAEPDINISETKINASLAIVLNKRIKQDCTVQGNLRDLHISNYRQSLQKALKETFKYNFTDITFSEKIPATGVFLYVRSAKPIGNTLNDTMHLKIQYRISIGSEGEHRKNITRTVNSRYGAAAIWQMNPLVKDALETTCEDIYNTIFHRKENLAVFALKGRQYEISQVSGKQRIAVLNFKRNQGISYNESKYLTERVRSGLIKTGLFDVITNDQIKAMFELKSLRQALNTGCQSKNCQINIGKALECKYVVVGDIQHAFNEFSIAVKILNVNSQKYIHAEDINVKQRNDLPRAAKQIVHLITGKRE